jgi:hypothetical protein
MPIYGSNPGGLSPLLTECAETAYWRCDFLWLAYTQQAAMAWPTKFFTKIGLIGNPITFVPVRGETAEIVSNCYCIKMSNYNKWQQSFHTPPFPVSHKLHPTESPWHCVLKMGTLLTRNLTLCRSYLKSHCMGRKTAFLFQRAVYLHTETRVL